MEKIFKAIVSALFWWSIIFPQLTYPYKEIPKNAEYKLWIIEAISNN